MGNWIKKNLNYIFIAAGIVALSLVVNTIYTFIRLIASNSSIGNNYIVLFTFIQALGVFVVSIIFIIMGARHEFVKYLIILAIVVYNATDIAMSVYAFIENGFDAREAYAAVVDLLLMIFMILSLTNRSYIFTTLVILLIDSAPLLLQFNVGGELALASLIINVLLFTSIYCFNKNETQTSAYYS